jgi:septum site-determining protein MinC
VTSVAPIQTNNVTLLQRRSIRFQARSFLVFALTPEPPLTDWLPALDRWLVNSPGFFAGRPVVLDLSVLACEAAQIRMLIAELGRRQIRVFAIEANGVRTLDADLPPLLRGTKPGTADEDDERTRAAGSKAVALARKEAAIEAQTLIIDTPVRSGQSIYHPHGDVIVIGSAGSGSEIIAGGSIHVYGTLRGRAFAGAAGNPAARIFCRRNEAELLAVDGWYRTADEMELSSRGKPVQAFLQDGLMRIAVLS